MCSSDLDEALPPFEARGRQVDGSRSCIELSARSHGDEPERLLLVVCRDVTAQREGEAELMRARGELEHARRMEVVGSLAGGIAHDFNNLLTVVTSACDLMSEDLDSESLLAEDLAAIQHAARRGADLVRQLLAMSRGTRGEIRPTSLLTLIGSMRRLLTALAGDPIQIEIDIPRGLPIVEVDPVGLERVVVNLVSNAARAMPRGGQIKIGARWIGEDEVLPAALEPGPFVCLEVEDTGVGMSQEVRERVFEPFFTTRASGEGTGLGLSAAYGILRELRGTITVTSEPGQGSCFRVYLPISDRLEPGVAVEEGRAHQEISVQRVLLVEDEPVIRSLVTRILERKGIEVRSFSRPMLALAALETSLYPGAEAPADLMITDVKMPGMLGPDLVERLRVHWPELPVVFITGDGGQNLKARDLGRHRVLAKPFNPAALFGAIAELMADPR